MSSVGKLNGIIVALITPFDSKGKLAPERARKLIESHIETGVQGFYVGGSSGEGFLQSVEERREYLQFVANVCANRVTLIAQVGALSSRDAWTLADDAGQIGYDIVSSTPPFYYSYTEQEVLDYYRELAERSPLPIMLYNAPHTTGRKLSLDAQAAMLKLPNVIGSKHTDTNLFTAERLMQTLKGVQFVNGPDDMLTAGLAMGMVGGIGTTYNFIPRIYLDIYRHVKNGDLASARASQAIANELIDELIRVSPSVIPGTKLALDIQGYDVGPARKPFQKITADTSRFEKLLKDCDAF